MNIWSNSNTEGNNLGSVKSLVAYLVIKTFASIEEFAQLIEKIIIFPSDVSPDYKIFICGSNTGKLQKLEKYITDNPWYT